MLMDLPSELLEKIIFNTYREDLVNFATTNTRIHTLAKSALERHQRLLDEYSRICGTGEEGFWAKLVVRIIKNPVIGRYVTDLEVHGLFAVWTADYQGLGYAEHNKYPESMMSMLRKVISNKSYLTDQSKDLWVERLERGDENAVIALLPPLLPNLSRLKIAIAEWVPSVYEYTCLHAALDEALENPNLMLLSKLHAVKLTTEGWRSLHTFKRFIQIPSLRIMQGCNLQARNYDPTLMHTSIERSSIKTLILQECEIDTKLAASAIESTKHLECFSYTALHREARSQPDPYWIRGSLLASARDTLRFLQFIPHPVEEGVVAPNSVYRYLGSLRGFRVLETVIVDCLLLFNGFLAGRHSFGTELPRSIRNLLLHVGEIETPSDFSEDGMSSSASASSASSSSSSSNDAGDIMGGAREANEGSSSITKSIMRASPNQVSISTPMLSALQKLLDEKEHYLPNLSLLRIVGLDKEVVEAVLSSGIRERFSAIGIAFSMAPKDSVEADQFVLKLQNFAVYKVKPWYHEDMMALYPVVF